MSTVLCALADLQALLAAAAEACRPRKKARPRPAQEHDQPPSTGSVGAVTSTRLAHKAGLRQPGTEPGIRVQMPDKQYARALTQAERKVWFMLVWAAEQPDALYSSLSSQVQAVAATLALQQQQDGSAPAAVVLNEGQRPHAHAARPAVRIQEL